MTAPVPTVAGLLAALHATTRDDQATRIPETTPEPDELEENPA